MALLLTLGSPLTCAHGGRGAALGLAPRVLVGGAPALTASAPVLVQACPNMAAAQTGSQHTVVARFCLQGMAAGGSLRVTSQGAPLLLASSVVTAMPSGEPLVLVPAQARVNAT